MILTSAGPSGFAGASTLLFFIASCSPLVARVASRPQWVGRGEGSTTWCARSEKSSEPFEANYLKILSPRAGY